MEQIQRIFLYAALLIIAFFLWQSWNKYEAKQSILVQNQSVQKNNLGSSTGFANIPASTTVTTTIKKQASQLNSSVTESLSRQMITVHTDVLNVGIDLLGGNIVSLNLPKYPTSIKTPNNPFTLLSNNADDLYVAESALMGKKGPDSESALAHYSSAEKNYQMKGNELTVSLRWHNASGLTIVKNYVFHKGSYLINVNYTIENKGNKTWTGAYYTQIIRKEVKQKESHLFQIHPYYGAALSSPAKQYQEISFEDMTKQPIQQTIKNGWVAMVQRYFVSAWVPESNEAFNYYSKVDGDIYTIGMYSNPITVAPGETKVIGSKFYSGPEVTSTLKSIAPGLEQTVSYGWLWFISVIIFWVMEKIYIIVGNWGWSIIIVTVLIKLMFYHLSAKSYSSMAKMRKLQPKIQALRERFADDKQKQSQAMMELYKKEKVNPVGGCLPIIVQIPVFFALYMVLIESVQLRQAPWILWIHDLSVPDPYFVLPVLMAITMFIQQKLNPPPPDPTQAKIMMFLPVVFGFLFAYFPAGLVLYWVVNNGLSILQQWYITTKFEKNSEKVQYKKLAKR